MSKIEVKDIRLSYGNLEYIRILVVTSKFGE